MREIKFRAWDEHRNAMRSWDDIIEMIMPWGLDWLHMLQYTGLKDKNGVEIYEGDIIKSGEFVWVVKYEATPDGEIETGARTRNPGENWAVIGNIYENPGLPDEWMDPFPDGMDIV